MVGLRIGWEKCSAIMGESLYCYISARHLISVIDKLEFDYRYYSMLKEMDGFVWNEDERVATAPDHVWARLFQVNPDFKTPFLWFQICHF